MMFIHVGAGLLAILAGAMAMTACKGGPLHRKAGMAFVLAMLIMASVGAVLAVIEREPTSISAAVLTIFLVGTGTRAVRGPSPNLARHLVRMGAALFIATGSFFLGQADVFPQPLRGSGLLAIPVLLTIGSVLYWLVRIRLAARAGKRFDRHAFDGRRT